MPVLSWVCALTLFGIYFVEKYKLYEHCRKPPRMSKNLIHISIYCLYIGLVLHIIFSISMLGNTNIFSKPFEELITENTEKFDSSKKLTVRLR